MQPISSVVQVNIIRGVRSITKAGFGTPLMLANTATFSGIRTYASLNEVATDFLSSSDEYKMALKMFSAEIKPRVIKIMRRSTATAMVQTITPDVTTQSVTGYTVTINGVPYTFTSDATPTATEVVAGLLAAINADGPLAVTASGTTTLILTSDVPGIPFSVSVGPKLSVIVTTPGNSLVDDAIQAANLDLDWYALAIVSRSEAEALAVAQWIETQRKLFVFSSSNAGIKTVGSTTDFASKAKALNLTRTVTLFSGDAANFSEGAWISDEMPRDPGSYTEKFKTLVNVPADNLSATEIAAVKAKSANVYTNVGSVDIVSEGVVASGEFVDVIRFIDWLQAQIEENVYTNLVSVPKIPFTNKGIAVIEGQLRFALDAGVAVGGLADDQPYEVIVPRISDISLANRAARNLTGIKFYAKLAGAIHFVGISGTVGV